MYLILLGLSALNHPLSAQTLSCALVMVTQFILKGVLSPVPFFPPLQDETASITRQPNNTMAESLKHL